jgi:hypothetical protein
MNEQAILEQLLELLQAGNVKIRTEPMGGGGGGLCLVKGENIFFADSQAQSLEVAILAAKAAARIIDIDGIYIRPEVREFIENHKDAEPAKNKEDNTDKRSRII